MKKFPTLFKLTSTNAIQYWKISVEEFICNYGKIITEYGQLRTDKPQITTDIISVGKNNGKTNETTPYEQAIKEAEATWDKKLKSGYVKSEEEATSGKVDSIVEGGVLPMLAFTFEKQGSKIKYPCFSQPKLDGLRIICILKDGKATLWSRTRKQIFSLPHVIAEIERNFKEDIILDGEGYSDKLSNNFEHIVHLVKQEEPDKDCTEISYHVYDVVNKDTFENRYKSLLKHFENTSKFKYLKLVETFIVDNEEQVTDFYTKFKAEGKEGAMLRNAKGLYVNKRSSDLIKVKEMQDSEFKIVGIEEGRGKLAGHVGAFVCAIGNEIFKTKMSGGTAKLKEYFENHSLWKDKLLTVQFQDYTSYGIPRFPIGLRIREDV